MPRKPKDATRDRQVYKLPQYRAVVTIEYDVDKPPPFFQPGPGVVIVGEHVCAPPAATLPPVVNRPEDTNGPTQDTPDMIAWKAARDGALRKPYTSEDAARDAGFNVAAVNFDNVQRIAAEMPPIEESLVE